MSARAWITFAAVAVLWGIPYLFIKIAVDDGMPPAFLSWVRVALAAAVLSAIAWRMKLFGSLRGRWRAVGLYAVTELAIPFPLIAAGEQEVSSSLTAILIASMPLAVALIALRVDRDEQASGRRLAGLLVGFAGVVALVGLDVAGTSGELLGALAILVATVGYGIGPFVLKLGLADVDPRATMAAALALATLMLTPFAAADLPSSAPSSESIVSIVLLGLLCTAAAMVFFGTLVAEAGPGRASVVTYVAPVIAVGLGVAVLGERPGTGAVAGLLLIVAGSWLSTDGRLPPGLGAVVTRLRRRRRDARPHPSLEPASG